MKHIYFTFLTICCIVFSNCERTNKPKTSKTADWQILFDGTSLDGWRGYNAENLPPGWSIVDSTLTFTTAKVNEADYDYKGSKDIIYGAEIFDYFELYLEWKLPEGGNSGIFYHIQEGFPGIPEIAPEYQLIDDDNYARLHDITEYNLSVGNTKNPSELQPMQKTASDYAMYAAPDDKILYPVGQWNSSRIVCTAQGVTYFLNGKETVSFDPNSEDWNTRRSSGKWKDFPNYARFKKGYIGFQDHGSGLAFRNIKIKKR